jgi:hypothetical protein
VKMPVIGAKKTVRLFNLIGKHVAVRGVVISVGTSKADRPGCAGAGPGSSFMTFGFCKDCAAISDNLDSAHWLPHRGETG